MPGKRLSSPCKTCGHDVNGPPPKDVRRERECFPCLAGKYHLLAIEIKKERNRLWDALSDILEEPALAIPLKLRKCGLRAINFCADRDVRRRTSAK